MAPILKLDNVSKVFKVYQVQKTLFRLGKSLFQGTPFTRDLWALKNVSFEIFEGDKIGIIGRNGAGKTTLLRIATGIYRPTGGSLSRTKPLTPLFRYAIGLSPYLPVIDNIYIVGAFYGLSILEIGKKIEEILDFAELGDLRFLPVKKLSAGQYQRLSFSVFKQNHDSFLAFDESMSLADHRFQKKSGDYFSTLMKDTEKTVIFASHALGHIRKYCQKAIWLECGEIRKIGPAEEIAREYEKFCSRPLPEELGR